jgi:uncharacterized protein YjhX (UPF0386 family)
VSAYKHHEHIFNYELYTNKQQGKASNVDCWKYKTWFYKQLVVTNTLREYFNSSDVWLAIFKKLWHRKKAAYSVNFSEHIQNTSALQT